MKPFRLERLDKELLRIINNAILYKGNDPRLQMVTVTEVQLSPDMQFCKVFFSVFDEDIDIPQWIAIMTKASGFIKKEIASTKILRRIPEIKFVYDDTEERARALESILDSVDVSEDKDDEDDSPSE